MGVFSVRAKYIKPRKGAKIPKWRIQYFDDEGNYLGSEMGFKLKETTREHAEAHMLMERHRQMRAEAGMPQLTGRNARELVTEYIEAESPKGGIGGEPWTARYKNRVEIDLTWWVDILRISKPGQVSLPAVEKALNASTWIGSTRNIAFKRLNGWMNWCRRRHYIAVNPLEDFTRYSDETKDPRRPLTPEEAWKLFRSVPGPYALMYMMAILTGIRVTAMSKVAPDKAKGPDHIDWDKKGVRISKGSQKNRKGQFYPLPDWYLEALRAYLLTVPKAKVVFPFMRPVNQATKLQRHLKKAGVPFRTSEGKVDFHALRVTFGTWVNESGADTKTLQTLLGHSDVRVSLGIYVKANDTLRRAAVEDVGTRLMAGGSGTQGVQSLFGPLATPDSIGVFAARRSPGRNPSEGETSKDAARTSADIQEVRAFLGSFLAAAQPGTRAGHRRTPGGYPLGTTLPECLALLHRLNPEELAEVLDLARALLARREGRAQA